MKESTSTGVLRKALVYFLIILFVMLTVGCVLLAWLFVEENFYTTPKKTLTEQSDYNLMRRDGYDILRRYLIPEGYSSDYPPDVLYAQSNTNLRYVLTDHDGNILSSNAGISGFAVDATETGESETDAVASEELPILSETLHAEEDVPAPDDVIPDSVGDPAEYLSWTPIYYRAVKSTAYGTFDIVAYTVKPVSINVYTFWCKVDEHLSAHDNYHFVYRLYDVIYNVRYAIYPIGILTAALAVFLYIILMNLSARRPKDEGLYPGALNRVPFDVLLAVSAVIAVFGFYVYHEIFLWHSDAVQIIGLAVLALAALCVFLGLSMSAAARIKEGTLFTNTVIWHVLKWLGKGFIMLGRGLRAAGRMLIRFFRSIPMIWRTILLAAGIGIFNIAVFVLCDPDFEIYLFFHILEFIVIVPLVLWITLTLRRLQKGGIALADGNLAYQVDTKGMFWDFRKHGENLNQIAEGMNRAVEQRMKSERMKTELITNVSHDIKTPLTSIINYADLISKEECDNPKVHEYTDVLLRQSERLKRLIDDLVEASKASTGNLEVQLAPCDLAVFLEQAAGEYEQKLADAGLTLLTSCPDHAVCILADGRRLWRVFDNLMNNIRKYALSGTRVYLTLEESHGFAVVTFRNVSRDPLNLTPEELMERFVRGDESRSSATEGNGLGLSIAQSLVSLQGGAMTLAIDGDLFKVTLHFPIRQEDGILPVSPEA